MAQGKVEICGVNTSKLPLLKEEEKEACSCVLRREIWRQRKNTSREISDWYSVLLNAFQTVMKIRMICFRSAALD